MGEASDRVDQYGSLYEIYFSGLTSFVLAV